MTSFAFILQLDINCAQAAVALSAEGRCRPDLQLCTFVSSKLYNDVYAIRFGKFCGIETMESFSSSRLHLAAWSGQAAVVSYLCENKADVGAATMDDMGAIHFAAQKGHLKVVQILISSGVYVKSANHKGMTALHYAAQGSSLELVKYLVKKGANLDDQSW